VLGVVGGFVGLIWSLIGWGLGGYEAFRFNQEIVSEIYSTTDERRFTEDAEPQTHEEARSDLTRSLETKRRYDYTYVDFLAGSWL